MSRPLRIEYPDAWYHVLNRGRQREAIFPEAKDYETFPQTVSSGVERMKANLGRDKKLAGKVRSLVSMIIKSQEQT